jgi:endonuclease/exonuclease/phosphatase family metal-dependent hydrolase
MIPALEAKFHRWRRRLSRSEWAIKHLGLTPSEGTSEKPGLLLIQIDGLARHQLEHAIAHGDMPFLRQLMQREGYRMNTFYSGLPSTTPAVQAELYYGVRSAVPAFSFYDRATRQVGRMFNPEWAKHFEASYQAAGHEGLLKGGSSWSNIYTGGAAQEESHFCGASIGFGDMWRTGKIRNIFVFILLQFPAALRIAWQLILKTGVAIGDAIYGMRHGEKFGLELIMAISRIFIGTGLRELVTIGGKVDLARGLPIVHVNFLAYDEQSHRRGPSSGFAHWALRPTDRAIKNLYRQAQRSSRRDYAVWVFSDHGQEATRSFAVSVPGGIEEAIYRCLETSVARDPAWKARSQRRLPPGWYSRHPRVQSTLAAAAMGAPAVADNELFTVTAVGPIGHVYFHQPLDLAKRTALARRLVTEGAVPGVLLKTSDDKITWYQAKGETSVPDEVPALLPHPEPMRAEIAHDLIGLCNNVNSGDLILLGWSPWEKPWTFAPERGAHGGIGPEETQGFALLPPRTRLPEGTKHFIRPSALRAAALHLLGRVKLNSPPSVRAAEEVNFRVMTYNVHGCSGMDGRISPRRVARTIDDQAPDIVALQEIDLGRKRSRAEDQGKLIAEHLGMHFLFCQTVTHGDGEHYGHMVLSRWPLEIVKRGLLPSVEKGWWPEPRAALWARVQIAGRDVHVVTTHLGLSPRERQLQIAALLGDEWIGGIPLNEPVILCGDFNLTPRSRPYALAAKKLRDVQRAVPGHKPRLTFTSARPFTRLDYIFISNALRPSRVSVPRNHLTRVASDHLPLVADLSVDVSTSDKTAHSSAESPPNSRRSPPVAPV